MNSLYGSAFRLSKIVEEEKEEEEKGKESIRGNIMARNERVENCSVNRCKCGWSDFLMAACLHCNWSRVEVIRGSHRRRLDDGGNINGGNVFLCFRCDGASWSRLLL